MYIQKIIHIHTVDRKTTRENKTLGYNPSNYIHNKEYELVYVAHRNSISLRNSVRSKKFVYSESRDSHNSLIEVATQI